MSHDKLIYMANQIAKALRSRPHAEAVSGIADHISSFWEPRMRKQLFALLDTHPAKFDALVLEAQGRIRPVRSD